jgi:hypothetical protein
MSNNKQSSVEWYIIERHNIEIESRLGKISSIEYDAKLIKAEQQAKAMRKKEITEAFDEGQEYEYQYHINSAPKFDSETYYNETYGNNNDTRTEEPN